MKETVYIKPGQRFYSKSKVDPEWRYYEYIGDNREFGGATYYLTIREIETGEICEVEPEWFSQRQTKWE